MIWNFQETWSKDISFFSQIFGRNFCVLQKFLSKCDFFEDLEIGRFWVCDIENSNISTESSSIRPSTWIGDQTICRLLLVKTFHENRPIQLIFSNSKIGDFRIFFIILAVIFNQKFQKNPIKILAVIFNQNWFFLKKF